MQDFFCTKINNCVKNTKKIHVGVKLLHFCEIKNRKLHKIVLELLKNVKNYTEMNLKKLPKVWKKINNYTWAKKCVNSDDFLHGNIKSWKKIN